MNLCACVLCRQIEGYILRVYKVRVCVLMIYLPWSGLCFQFGGCQSSGWWSVRAGSLMHVERAGSIGARQCLCHQTHTNTHAVKCHAQICTQPHTLSGHSACTQRGPHAHDPLPPVSCISYVSERRKRRASEMTGNYYPPNLPRNRIKQQQRPSESWIQTVRSGSVYLLNHHEEPH